MKKFITQFNLLKYKYSIDEFGNIVNEDKKKPVKHCIDKRRPKQCPVIYLQLKPKGRMFIYLDELMAIVFLDNYKRGMNVIHLDGDNLNCNLSNLSISNGVEILRKKYNENKIWKQVSIKNIHLYYDYYICEDGRLYNSTTDNFIKPEIDSRDNKHKFGYKRYSLYTNKMDTTKEQKEYRIKIGVARLVALHFIPMQPNKNKIIFKDCNWENCNRDNLYWGDQYDVICKHKNVRRDLFNLTIDGFGTERWKPLKYFDYDFYDEYLISDFGRIYNKSKGFYVSILNSSYKNRCNQHYKSVLLKLKTTYFKQIPVHRLVAYNFIENKYPKLYNSVNHINGNPECNLYTNLEWCSHEWNMHHALNINLLATLDNGKFTSVKNKEYWRTISVVAWTHAIDLALNVDNAYLKYNNYRNLYPDDCSELTLQEFSDIYMNKYNNLEIENLTRFYIENFS